MSDFKYLFGPVPSRRFGLSLGVDLVPRKTCTLDCIFCEVGPTTDRTLVRKEYVPVAEVLKELADWFALNRKADFITVTGSGEPTLHTRFGDVLSAIRSHERVRSALLTNSTLLHLPEVRAGAALADVVKVSLSAWDQASFAAITRPADGVDFLRMVEGLRMFRQDFSGELWMEVFIVPGLNDLPAQVAAIAALARTIRPDRVQLNTAVRPTARQNVPALAESQLRSLAEIFTPAAEVIARFAPGGATAGARHADKSAVLAMLARRPCTVGDVAHAFALSREEAGTMIRELLGQCAVRSEVRNGENYYSVV